MTVKNYLSLSNRENEILRQLKTKLAIRGGKGQEGVDKEEFWAHIRKHFGGEIASQRMGQIAFMAGVKTVNEGGNARYFKHRGPHKSKAAPATSDPKPQIPPNANQVLTFNDASSVEVVKEDGGKFNLKNVKMKITVVIIGCCLLFGLWWYQPIEDPRWWALIFNKIFAFIGGQFM